MADELTGVIARALSRAVSKVAEQPRREGTATFVRREANGTCWVRLPGADVDTPANGGALAEAEPGQAVSYRIDGTRLTLIGNHDAPSVGSTYVKSVVEPVARGVAENAEAIDKNAEIAEEARRIADEADEVAKATDQHFFTDTNGVNVTQAAKDSWSTSHSGPNMLINSAGQLLRNGLNNLVSLTQSAIAFYDGAGNAASHLVASFGSSGVMQYVGGVLRSALTSAGLDIYDTDGSTSVASFGSTARIGTSSGSRLAIDSTAADFYDANNKKRTRINTSGLTTYGPDGSTVVQSLSATTSNASSIYAYGSMFGLLSDRVGFRVDPYSGGFDAEIWNGTSDYDAEYDTRSHSTRIVSNRVWSTDSTKHDTAEIQLNTWSGGDSPTINIWLYSGNTTAKGIELEANDTASKTDITTDHFRLQGVGCYMTHGSVGQTISAAANSVTTYPSSGYVSFGHTYLSAPDVVVGFYSTSTAAGLGGLTIAVSEVTATGFKVKIFNNTSTARSPGFYWIAMG